MELSGGLPSAACVYATNLLMESKEIAELALGPVSGEAVDVGKKGQSRA